MAFGAKTNERPGTRAVVRHVRMSAYKAREVLDLIRGKHVSEADDILALVERDAAIVIRKALASAVANAQNNDGQDPETLFVSACYADEGPTLKRWRPRARGRATRIRKRTCHITVIVSRMADDDIARREAKQASTGRSGRRATQGSAAARRDRVARSRRRDAEKAGLAEDDTVIDEPVTDEPVTDESVASDAVVEQDVAADESTDVVDDVVTDEVASADEADVVADDAEKED